MDVKNSFVCVDNGDGVTVEQTVTKTMDFMESLKELEKLKQDKGQVETQIKQIKEAIESKKMETDLASAEENLKTILDLEESWNNALKSKYDALKGKLEKYIRVQKTKHRYKPNMKQDSKLSIMNTILGGMIAEHYLDWKMPIVRELRTTFDEI
jgi:chaperonin cofactor prefoldin